MIEQSWRNSQSHRALSQAARGHFTGLEILLVFSLLASTASQLRLGDSSVGLGELGLAAWIFLVATKEVLRFPPTITPAFLRLFAFWMVFALAMCFGTMAAYTTGDVHDPVWFRHDIVAYIFVAVFGGLTATEFKTPSHVRRVAWLLITLGAASLAFQIVCGLVFVRIGGFDLWEWDRLRGFCDNSNQLALVCAVIGLVSLHLSASDRLASRIVALTCLLIAIVAGRMSKSDAFLLVLVIGGPFYILLRLRTALLSRELSLPSVSVWVLVLTLPLVVSYFVAFGNLIVTQGQRTVKEMTRGGGSADTEDSTRLRFELWREAISRGVDSGMLGFGPGPHLEIPSSIVSGRKETTNEPENVIHPLVNFTPNFEAHNTFLDLFVQGGLIVVLDLVWLATTTMFATYRKRLDGLTTLFLGLAIYGTFHFIIRHPIVWFAIVYSLIEAFNVQKPLRARREDHYKKSEGLDSRGAELKPLLGG